MSGSQTVCISIVGDDDPVFDGEFTADNIAEYLRDLIEKLHRCGVSVVNIVSDNGQNFLNASFLNRSLTFGVRCVAHGLNLFTQKIIAEVPFVNEWFDWTVNQIQNQSEFAGVPKIAPTRWSSSAVSMTKAREVAHEKRILGRDKLSSFDIATSPLTTVVDCLNIVQPNSATLCDAIRALAICWDFARTWTTIPNPTARTARPLLQIFDDNLSLNMISDPFVVIAYLSGCVSFADFGESLITIIKDFIMSDAAARLVYAAMGGQNARRIFRKNQAKDPINTVRGALHRQLMSVGQGGRVKNVFSVKTAQLRLIELNRRTHAELSWLLYICLFEMKPTEASVEREFSRLKFEVPRERSSIASEHAAACLMINSASLWLRDVRSKVTVQVDVPEDTEEVDDTSDVAEELRLDDSCSSDEEAAEDEPAEAGAPENDDVDEEEGDEEEEEADAEGVMIANFLRHYVELANKCLQQEQNIGVGSRRQKQIVATQCFGESCEVHGKLIANHTVAQGKKYVCDNATCGVTMFGRCANISAMLSTNDWRCPKCENY
jgi:hypothetical protein